MRMAVVIGKRGEEQRAKGKAGGTKQKEAEGGELRAKRNDKKIGEGSNANQDDWTQS
jgi:hypothetical protein